VSDLVPRVQQLEDVTTQALEILEALRVRALEEDSIRQPGGMVCASGNFDAYGADDQAMSVGGAMLDVDFGSMDCDFRRSMRRQEDGQFGACAGQLDLDLGGSLPNVARLVEGQLYHEEGLGLADLLPAQGVKDTLLGSGPGGGMTDLSPTQVARLPTPRAP